MGGPGNFYGFPTEPDSPDMVKVAFHLVAGQEKLPIACPEVLDRVVAEEEVRDIRRVLARKIPSMVAGAETPAATATCMYTSTEDNHL
jgi:hypothetical protein